MTSDALSATQINASDEERRCRTRANIAHQMVMFDDYFISCRKLGAYVRQITRTIGKWWQCTASGDNVKKTIVTFPYLETLWFAVRTHKIGKNLHWIPGDHQTLHWKHCLPVSKRASNAVKCIPAAHVHNGKIVWSVTTTLILRCVDLHLTSS